MTRALTKLVILLILLSLSFADTGNWQLFMRNKPISSEEFFLDSGGKLWVSESALTKVFPERMRKLSPNLKDKFSVKRGEKIYLCVTYLKQFLDVQVIVQRDIKLIDIYPRHRYKPQPTKLEPSKTSRKREKIYREYKRYRTRYFEIYYKNPLILPPVKAVVDDYYKRIYDHLRFDVSVTPIKLVIALDKSEYLSYGHPEWSSGLAVPEERTIYVDEKDPLLIRRVIPHEITHIIVINYLGFDTNTTHWLNEGIAVYEEMRIWTGRDKVIITMNQYNPLPLEAVMFLSPAIFSNKANIPVFYQQSASIVSFLINEYGMDRFREFCEILRVMPMTVAMEEVYHLGIPELERKWRKFISSAKPTPVR